MKKTALFILATGILGFMALPVNAQKKVSLQEVQKESQKVEAAQTGAITVTPGVAAAPTPAPGTVVAPPATVP